MVEVIILGVFMTTALFFLLFYFAFNRRLSFLLFGLFCLVYSFISILNLSGQYVELESLTKYQTDSIICSLSDLANIFLIGFLLWELEIPYKMRWLFAYILLALAINTLFISFSPLSLMLSFAVLITTLGMYRKAREAIWIFIGIIGLLVHIYLTQENIPIASYNLDIIFFIGCIVISVGQKMKTQFIEKHNAEIRTTVLENQLLKKSIQPHFIYNSLTALQELIEQNPTGATQFVDGLAKEFRLMQNIAKERLIPIETELSLCNLHLKLMEFRKNASFEFITEGIKGTETIPPGIFHTLIENGITHGYGQKLRGVFKLKKERLKEGIRYVFFNDSQMEIKSGNDRREGTGLSYVRAQLEQSYKDNFELKSHAVDGGWEVIITIKKTS